MYHVDMSLENGPKAEADVVPIIPVADTVGQVFPARETPDPEQSTPVDVDRAVKLLSLRDGGLYEAITQQAFPWLHPLDLESMVFAATTVHLAAMGESRKATQDEDLKRLIEGQMQVLETSRDDRYKKALQARNVQPVNRTNRVGLARTPRLKGGPPQPA